MKANRLIAISVLGCMVFYSGLPAYADASLTTTATQTSAEAKLPQKYVGYSELRERVLKQNTTLKELKKSEESIVSGLVSFDSPYIHMSAFGLGPGTTGNREGYFYGYAKPILIGKANLEAQSVALVYNMNKLTSTLDYQLQKMLIDLGSSNEQLKLYTQKVEALKVKYAHANASYAKGLISKVQLLGAETEYKQTQMAVEKLSYQIKSYKLKVAELAALESGYDYSFEVPVDTISQYSIDKLDSYFETVKSSNQDLAVERANALALKNEEDVIKIYKQFVLKTDLLDFERRKSAQISHMALVEGNVYKQLRTLLSQLEDAKSDQETARDQADIAVLDFKTAVEKYRIGQITESAMTDAQLAMYTAQLAYSDKQKAYNSLVKRTDVFINAGIYLDGGQ